ncbi:MAG: hypothetical protein CVU77_00665 [Elusimicrobia bacterium HGW-Elusimicrobia-1]|jgi:glycosyltransferase involved in cell wall biosynthesis|nr:MAG: hypothetical protein CVU77_00665 [Elusimicrobia bacterium HGW-Elusimicrobia-1]
MKKITVIIPAYNEEKTAAAALRGVISADFASAGFAKEIIIVDDGSVDGTYDAFVSAFSGLSGKDKPVILRHARNMGKGAAVRTALAASTGDIIAIQDADLEYDPADIPRLAAPIAAGAALAVYGSRFLKKNPVIYALYYLGNRVMSGIIGLLFLRKVTDSYTCRKLFGRSVLDGISLLSRGFEIEAEITSKIFRRGVSILELPINYNPRTIRDGKKISFRDAALGVWTAVKIRFARRAGFQRLGSSPGVCLLSARFHPYVGGAEKQGLLLASKIAAQGREVTVCTQAYDAKLPRREIIGGADVHRIASSSSLRFLVSSFLFLAAKRKDFGVIHVLLASSPALAAVAAARLTAKKVLIKLGCSGEYGDIATSRRTVFGRIKLFLLKRSKAMFVCPGSDVFAEALSAGFRGDRLTIIPNGVDTSRFAPSSADDRASARAALGMSGEGRAAIFTGRFEKQKGLEGLLAEWPAIVGSFPDVKLILAGAGSLEKNLRAVAAASPELASSVIFAPPSEQVERYLAAADFFVLPSLAEGLSNSMLEAMSCGLAVVVTDVGGAADAVVDGVNGFLSAPSAENFAAKLRAVLAMPESVVVASRAAARRTAIERFGADKTAESYIKLYMAM